jgi:hypothetical protein
MTGDQLIAHVRAGDVAHARALLDGGVPVDVRDEHDWTPLCWAAGSGDVAMLRLLLDRGADVCAAGADGRTPYQIAVAAGRRDAARVLKDAGAARGVDATSRDGGQTGDRPYCRAYELRELRRYAGWTEAPSADMDASGDDLTDDLVVFVHRDCSVTRTIWPHESMLFDGRSEDWRRFCRDTLRFDPDSFAS